MRVGRSTRWLVNVIGVAGLLSASFGTVGASNMGLKAEVFWPWVEGHENFHVVSLPFFDPFEDADTFLLEFWRGFETTLERHDPWTDEVTSRTVRPGPAGTPVFEGENFTFEAGMGYILRLDRSTGGTLTGSHDPSVSGLELPWDPARTNVRHVAVPFHTTWETADQLLLDAWTANGGVSLTAIRYDNRSDRWLVRSVAPGPTGEPVLAGTPFALAPTDGITVRLDADPGPGGAVLPLPHY